MAILALRSVVGNVEELLNVDLSYAPPFSGVWDPVLLAAEPSRLPTLPSTAVLGDERPS